MLQTIAQKRAKDALEKIRAYEGESSEKQKRINSYVSSFGPMILMNGFGQACAFYIANNKEEHLEVFKILEGWLKSDGQVFYGEHSSLMECITTCNASRYQLAQVEALAYLDWLKKFAKAFLKSDADDTEEAEDAAAA